MSLLKGLKARARSIFAAGATEARMEEEFRFHVEMEARRLQLAGVPVAEAQRRALVAFGGMDHHREAMRDGRGARWLDDLAGDVRYALRAVRRSPGFAAAVAVTLGIGIGINGIIFGFVNSLLFRPLPARDPRQLVAMFVVDTRSGDIGELAYDDYRDYRDRSGAFAGLAGAMGVPLNLVASAGQGAAPAAADMVWGEMVTEDYFAVLDMRPALGRLFRPSDAPQGANPFAVLSYDSWQRRFHGDSSVVGRVVRINGTEFTITGVAPRGFRGMRTFSFWPEMWVPAGMHDVIQPGSGGVLNGRGRGWMLVFGRMRPGRSIAETQRDAAAFASQLAREYAATNANFSVMLIPAAAGYDHPGFVKPRVLMLASVMGIFAAVVTLLIICANLANMQLARAAARAREIAIRLSLGCSRARLTRQLVVESLVLAIPGALVAAFIVRLSPFLEQYMVPRLQFRVGLNAAPDYRVALFTALAGVLAVALFGLAPALRASRPDLVPALSSVIGEKRRGARQGGRLRGVLVVSQLAMSVILLVGGTLFVRSLFAARGADLGFDASDRLLMSVNLGLQNKDEQRGRRFYDDVLTRTRALPAVVSAAWAFPVPFDTYGRGLSLYVEGAHTRSKDGTIVIDGSWVSEDFVKAMGLRLQSGRDFTLTDSAGTPRVMVVSRSLATRLWPGKDPVGQRARLGGASGTEITVIGVVGDATFASVGTGAVARAYIPLRQRYRDWSTLVVHTRGDPAAVAPQVRSIVASLDPTLPTFGVMSMRDAVESGFSTSRMAASISGFFGVFALLIAAVGLYAVVAASVSDRTREIGVRMALGSTPSGVLRFIMWGGARLGAWGLAIGLAGAAGVAKSMGSLLFGLSPGDPVTFALVPLVLALVVLVATYLPARRAVKLDPVAALRSE